MGIKITQLKVSAPDLLEKLRDRTLCEDTFRYRIWLEDSQCPSGKMFYRAVQKETFKISLLESGKRYRYLLFSNVLQLYALRTMDGSSVLMTGTFFS